MTRFYSWEMFLRLCMDSVNVEAVVSLAAVFSLVTHRCVTRLKTAARETSIIIIYMLTFIYVSLAVSVERL